jgi:hypothetical protein
MAAIQEHLLRHRRAPEVAAHEVLVENVDAAPRGPEAVPDSLGQEMAKHGPGDV